MKKCKKKNCFRSVYLYIVNVQVINEGLIKEILHEINKGSKKTVEINHAVGCVIIPCLGQ